MQPLTSSRAAILAKPVSLFCLRSNPLVRLKRLSTSLGGIFRMIQRFGERAEPGVRC